MLSDVNVFLLFLLILVICLLLNKVGSKRWY